MEMGAEAWRDPSSRWLIRAERCEQVSLMEPSLRGTGQRDGGRWLLSRGWLLCDKPSTQQAGLGPPGTAQCSEHLVQTHRGYPIF